jgi:hypothetical protein
MRAIGGDLKRLADLKRLGQVPRMRLVVGAVIVGAIVVVTFVTHRGASIPSVTMTAKDYSFQMPGTLPNGLVHITFKNAGKQPHQANIARLNKGVTAAKVQQQLNQNMDAALGLVTLVGGPNTVDPGGSQQVVLRFSPGEYVAICFVAGPDGKPHFMKGMLKFFSVSTSSSGASSAPSAPSVDGTVTLKEFVISVPTHLTAGSHTWLVSNVGTQPHEMDLIKLASGKSASDVLGFLKQPQPSGPPLFADAGGLGALAPGSSAWVMVTLTKGNYVALCFVPDSRNGTPHVMEGMMTQFTIK